MDSNLTAKKVSVFLLIAPNIVNQEIVGNVKNDLNHHYTREPQFV